MTEPEQAKPKQVEPEQVEPEPVDKTKYLLVGISDDKMEALLTVLPFAQKGIDLNANDVLGILKNKNISFGINQHAIGTTIDEVRKKNVTVINEVIAKGLRPVNGNDGKVEILFNTKSDMKPVADDEDDNEGAPLDFHNINIIQNVKKDQPLARLTPSTTGTAGKNIFGQDVEPKPSIECGLPAGPETMVSDNDENLLVSCIDGNVEYKNNIVIVSPGLTIEKDVDFSIGNISYKGPVVIKGDVKGGFTVEATDDITIGGIVQNSIVRSGRNITIKGGFVGTGEGKMEAKEDVTLGFARNQTIIANNITFLKESVDCFIFAKENVEAKGGRLSIVGGILAAGVLIDVDVLGSRIEATMEVEIGVNYVELRGLMNIKRKLKETKDALEKISLEIGTMEDIKKRKGTLPQRQQEVMEKFLNQEIVLKKNLMDFGVKEKIASKKVQINKEAEVIVRHIVYPGVIIKMGDVTHTVQEELGCVRFCLEGDEIKATSV
ncbi:MAG: DUF342 domain-containing protein [Candidatus Anammoxibacter sp.]